MPIVVVVVGLVDDDGTSDATRVPSRNAGVRTTTSPAVEQLPAAATVAFSHPDGWTYSFSITNGRRITEAGDLGVAPPGSSFLRADFHVTAHVRDRSSPAPRFGLVGIRLWQLVPAEFAAEPCRDGLEDDSYCTDATGWVLFNFPEQTIPPGVTTASLYSIGPWPDSLPLRQAIVYFVLVESVGPFDKRATILGGLTLTAESAPDAHREAIIEIVDDALTDVGDVEVVVPS